MASDYTESTVSSDDDSIEKFKIELMARTASPSPRELETYHPRDMAAGVFTPYRAPTPEQAVVVLNRPMPLPSSDFVPKPILKRQSSENVQQNEQNAGGSGSPVVNEKMQIAKGIKSFFKRDKRSTTERNTAENQIMSNPNEKSNAAAIAAEIEAKRQAKENEELKQKEAERIMQEEAHAAVDHYSDLVRQVSSTKKYHTPLYLDRHELKKAAAKAALEGLTNTEDTSDYMADMKLQRSQSPDRLLMPPMNNKPRLSISERGQLIHVRETASTLAYTKDPAQLQQPDSPSDQDALPFSASLMATKTVIEESTVERPDARGRTRIVKVKRIIKKRIPSGTRSRDTSASRTPSNLASNPNIMTDKSASPSARHGKSLATESQTENGELAMGLLHQELIEFKSPEQMSDEAHEKVRSALSYSTDIILFIVACYVYLFKDAKLVLPILALIIYRQLGEAINAHIPNWLKKKKI